MAIDPARPSDRDGLVLRQKKFYPTKIPIGHSQLRHLISCPGAGRVYLVNRRTVYCLNTLTNRRIFITELPFEARCSATGHGWFCAGGEEYGYFAAIEIPEGGAGRRRGLHDQIPTGAREYWNRFYRPNAPSIRVERLGEQIVNSISIHRLKGVREGQDEVIAVLTNNDQSVRMWSLSRDAEVKFESFSFPMNHATISPDGTMLVIVGDEEEAYFYRRIDLASAEYAAGESSFRWERWRIIRLHKHPEVKHAEYFTTAWSSSGRLLATASQQGYITVFDVSVINDIYSDEDPVVALVPSSRPSALVGPGAIRTMCFAPEPWDLLLWGENSGRIGIGDLRSGLMTRQIVDLDPTGEGVETADLADFSSPLEESGTRTQDLGRGLGGMGIPGINEQDAAGALARDYAALRNQRRQQIHSIAADSEGLTDEEWQRLDMLRTTRQREEAIQRANNQISNERHVLRGHQYDSNGSRETPSIPVTPNVESSSTNPNRAEAFMDSIRHYARENSDSISANPQEDVSMDQPPGNPRSSVIPSTGHLASSAPRRGASGTDAWQTIEAALVQMANGTLPISGGTGNTEADANYANLPPIVQLQGSDSARSQQPSTSTAITLPRPAAEIDERRLRQLAADLEQLSSQSQDRHELMARRNMERERERHRERERVREARREAAQVSNYEAVISRRMGLRMGGDGGIGLRRFAGSLAIPTISANGLNTTGVAWDEERHVVYAGTEEGVFELQMNFDDRKWWPSIEMR